MFRRWLRAKKVYVHARVCTRTFANVRICSDLLFPDAMIALLLLKIHDFFILDYLVKE